MDDQGQDRFVLPFPGDELASPRIDPIHRIALSYRLEIGQRRADAKGEVAASAHGDTHVLAEYGRPLLGGRSTRCTGRRRPWRIVASPRADSTFFTQSDPAPSIDTR